MLSFHPRLLGTLTQKMHQRGTKPLAPKPMLQQRKPLSACGKFDRDISIAVVCDQIGKADRPM